MNGDYLKIEHVDNGFTITLNEYSSSDKGKGRGRWIAADEVQLIEIVRKVFPDSVAATKKALSDLESTI